MADITKTIQYYIDRLSSIYRGKPKAQQTIALLVKQMLADGLIFDVQDAFDIDTAVGAQLDVIGKYVGVSREVGVPNYFTNYFGFVDYNYPTGDQNLNGFISYSDPTINQVGVWLTYGMSKLSTSQLPDFSYRQLIKLKITTNSSNNTMSEVQAQIKKFFEGQIQLKDNQNMTMDYFYGSGFQLPVEVLERYLPRPMGVGTSVARSLEFNVLMDGISVYNSSQSNPTVSLGEGSSVITSAFTISNIVDHTFTVQGIEIDGPFEITDITPALSATIANGEEITFNLSFVGSVLEDQVFSGTLNILTTSAMGVREFPATITYEVVVPKNLVVSIGEQSGDTSTIDLTCGQYEQQFLLSSSAGTKDIDIYNISITEPDTITQIGEIPTKAGVLVPSIFSANICGNGQFIIEHSGVNSPTTINLTVSVISPKLLVDNSFGSFDGFYSSMDNLSSGSYPIYLSSENSNLVDITSIQSIGDISLEVPFTLPITLSDSEPLQFNVIAYGVINDSNIITISHTGSNSPHTINVSTIEDVVIDNDLFENRFVITNESALLNVNTSSHTISVTDPVHSWESSYNKTSWWQYSDADYLKFKTDVMDSRIDIYTEDECDPSLLNFFYTINPQEFNDTGTIRDYHNNVYTLQASHSADLNGIYSIDLVALGISNTSIWYVKYTSYVAANVGFTTTNF